MRRDLGILSFLPSNVVWQLQIHDIGLSFDLKSFFSLARHFGFLLFHCANEPDNS